MKKILKQTISLLLVLSLVGALCAVSALAESKPIIKYYNTNQTITDAPVNTADSQTVAVIISGEGTVALPDVDNMTVFINGSTVTVDSTINSKSIAFLFAGDGCADFGQARMSLTNDVPLYTGSLTDVIAFSTYVLELLSSDQLACLNVTGNFDISTIFTVYSAVVKENASIKINAPSNPTADPNGLNIIGSLKLESGAEIIADEGQILELMEDATYDGITLYQEDEKGNFTEYINASQHPTIDFNFNTELQKWVKSEFIDPGRGYDVTATFDEDHASVAWYDAVGGWAPLNSGSPFMLPEGETITFTVTPNDGYTLQRLIVNGETVSRKKLVNDEDGLSYLYGNLSENVNIEAVIVKQEDFKLFGDCNKDSSINAKDVLLLKQYFAKWTVTVDEQLSDCNLDKFVNAKDLLLLRQYLANWDVALG